MKKILLSIVALAFVAGVSAPVFAAKHMSEKLAEACKDKKPGEMVKVDDKDVKCPAPKKDGKK